MKQTVVQHYIHSWKSMQEPGDYYPSVAVTVLPYSIDHAPWPLDQGDISLHDSFISVW